MKGPILRRSFGLRGITAEIGAEITVVVYPRERGRANEFQIAIQAPKAIEIRLLEKALHLTNVDIAPRGISNGKD